LSNQKIKNWLGKKIHYLDLTGREVPGIILDVTHTGITIRVMYPEGPTADMTVVDPIEDQTEQQLGSWHWPDHYMDKQ
jgi:hypothetical protein